MLTIDPAVLANGTLAQIPLPRLKALRDGLKAQINGKLCGDQKKIATALGLKHAKKTKLASDLLSGESVEVEINGKKITAAIHNIRIKDEVTIYLCSDNGPRPVLKLSANDHVKLAEKTAASVNAYFILQRAGFTGTMAEILEIINRIIETA